MPRQKPTTPAARWREAKLAAGLCGYCGDEPIAYPRSTIRGVKCLDRLKVSNRSRGVPKKRVFNAA